MSGIVACYRRTDDAIDPTVLERLCNRQSHRGPDGSSQWCDERVGLGHQLLATTPESRYETLPEADDGLVITADVRLDNREELLAALQIADGYDETDNADRIPDSRLLLEAYREWGSACPDRLLGAFAFVVWDRDANQLFCVRDHVGVKPLYYYAGEELFAVASELPALLELPAVSATPDEHWIGDYLAGRLEDERATGYTALERLPPAHSLTVTEEGTAERQYWSVDEIEPLPPVSDDRYRQQFRELFKDAVAVRLRGEDDRVGSLLSGGIDSSSIASVAAARRPRDTPPLPTFSAVFSDVPACDEREYIDAVLEQGTFEPHVIRGDRFGPLADVDELLEHFGRPLYPSLFMLVPRLYARAADEDVRTVLHGYGGDQVMGSDVRGYLRGLARRGRLVTLARELRAYRKRYPWLSWTDVLRYDLLEPLAPAAVRRLYHARFDTDRYVEGTLTSIDPAFARRTGLDERLAHDATCQPPQSQRTLRRRAVTTGEPTFNLELNDAAGAAIGVEPRYPYFDKRLIEFALALPPGETVGDGLDRTIVRDGLAGILPRAIRERDDKAEFSPNVVHGVRNYDLATIETTLFEGPLSIRRYVDIGDLEDAVQRLHDGEGTVTDARNCLMATTLERWRRP